MEFSPLSLRIAAILVLGALATAGAGRAEPLGDYWGTAEEEAKYYRIVELPIPSGLALEAGCFEMMPDGRLAIGTRRTIS